LEALKEFNDDAKRAILELLRSKVPLNAVFRELFADELEKYFYFPPSPHQKRKEERQLHARILETHIGMTMRSEGCSRPKALEKVAEWWFMDEPTSPSDPVEALKQRLKRAKREPG
jgi:hypothetical protein